VMSQFKCELAIHSRNHESCSRSKTINPKFNPC
jgi:hypothetical protein